uniref:Uncharacterized protein n=1 Tax=Caenorhabditis tropicalis TaxID=1561998 RepID=A0A1I7V3R2_9PELO
MPIAATRSSILVIDPAENVGEPVAIFQKTAGKRVPKTNKKRFPCTRFQCVIIWALIGFVVIRAFVFLFISLAVVLGGN